MSSAIFNIVEHFIDASHIREYPRATAQSQDEKLLLHVKQYVPRDNPSPQKGDLTIIGAHGNGFPKELYEPLWDDFWREAERRGVRIRSIWISDGAWQGRSGVLNQGKLGNDPSWFDYARDMVQVINTFRMPRPLFAIGHSFGANALVNVALMHPRFFNGLVLLDPVIGHFDSSPEYLVQGPAALSIHRRDVWPSRKAAADAFRRSGFYQAWDPRVLDRWIEHGIRPVSGNEDVDGEVTLATSKHQEVFTYMRPSWPAYDAKGTILVNPELAPDLDTGPGHRCSHPFYRAEGAATMARLPNVRPGTLYIIGAKSASAAPDICGDRVALTGSGPGGSGGVRAGRVKEVVHPDYGHLIPMEAPLFCAAEAAAWAKTELDRWWAEERRYDEWAKKPLADKVMVSDEYKRRLGVADRNTGRTGAKI
ncbi:alpha/beta hydrolase family protein [Hirsutella rhossiliensis]|uniref:Alpha/beta hydrolase family domain-containing protein n=1 Tax=Hirsutella rhossiliensis TaxID=111463 RepID=A0A9P8MPD5_9HYPO|nr:alpha/beta hydrolase family domain-containing protein [Hirsutella rhossiliensis]KAH0958770.1 alpha/beta hydrolase family domain-containing protein [Hirsutella rhossiliensis]